MTDDEWTDDEWKAASTEQKLDWLRANMIGLIRFANQLSGEISADLSALSRKLVKVQELIDTDPQGDSPPK